MTTTPKTKLESLLANMKSLYNEEDDAQVCRLIRIVERCQEALTTIKASPYFAQRDATNALADVEKIAGGEDDEDPSPWCSGCRAKHHDECDCGPIADND